jgi:6-phospho-beta-glucosidase
MKLCILGGGGFRTPYVYQALLRDQGPNRVTDVWLYDIEEQRLESMRALLLLLARPFGNAPAVHATLVLEDAIQGADFVFAAVRVGGLRARICDERVALGLGVLGQETTGPGGIAYAFRTVPLMLRIAELVKTLAPASYVINFTNPAGIITEAMQSILGDRVAGICDTPSGLGRRVAQAMGVDQSRIYMDYVGLNHLGWMRRLIFDGRDILPDFLASDDLLGGLEEAMVFGADWLRQLGVIPNEYLYYYYFNRDAVQAIRQSRQTRGEFLAELQGDFYQRVAHAGENAADLWRETVSKRTASYMAEAKGGEQGRPEHPGFVEADPAHQGYAGVAVALMHAVASNERSTLILNVRNGNTIPGLPADAVIEVPAAVDANGARPLATQTPALHQLGLMQQVKQVERHAISAAREGSMSEALLALALHPLVDSVPIARKLLDGYISSIPEVAAVFASPVRAARLDHSPS